jgi:hypothetical protein
MEWTAYADRPVLSKAEAKKARKKFESLREMTKRRLVDDFAIDMAAALGMSEDRWRNLKWIARLYLRVSPVILTPIFSEDETDNGEPLFLRGIENVYLHRETHRLHFC